MPAATNPSLSSPFAGQNFNIDTGIAGLNQGLGQAFKLNQSPIFDIFSTPQFGQIQSYLAPQNGGLSPGLQQIFNLGAGNINRQTGANVASAQTGALGRGLEGSSLEASEVNAARSGGNQSMDQLLASILGMQNQDYSQLASMLFGGVQGQANSYEDRLRALAGLYQSGGEGQAQNYYFQKGLDESTSLANQANTYGLIGAGIGAAGAVGGGYARRP